VLAASKELRPDIATKSGIMLGLGESRQETEEVLKDMRKHNVDIVTMGQYLRPSKDQLPVQRYVTPEEFSELGDFALSLGFKTVHSGPLVRSSYHAEEIAKNLE
jgi:lipoic acid synthetase